MTLCGSSERADRMSAVPGEGSLVASGGVAKARRNVPLGLAWWNGGMTTVVRGAGTRDVAAQISALGARADWPVVWDAACAFVTPKLLAVHEMWLAKRRGRRLPSRDDFSLSELRALAKNTAFIAAED